MRFQPKNPDPRWPNEHELYLAWSQGGKSQALHANARAPHRGVRTIMWDHAPDHPGDHFRTRQGFTKALKFAIQRGGGFRIAYAGPRTREEHEWWCEVVWSCLDGRYRTYAYDEEISAIVPGPGKADPNAATLLNEGRKFGLVWHGTAQRSTEIPKTYFEGVRYTWVGVQKTRAAKKRMADQIGVELDRIEQLQPMQFLVDDGGIADPRLVQIKGADTQKGVRWCD